MSNWKKNFEIQMKKCLLISIILLFTSVSYAQEDHPFYKHEIKLSVGDALLYDAVLKENERFYYNVSVAYLYRPVKWFWAGGNFVNYFGNRIYYHWREYGTDGYFRDFSESKIKYCAVIAPEIRLSYLNKEKIIFYSSFSGGIGWENGYDNRKDREEKYPRTIPYLQITYFGFSINFGRNDNIFLGGELGLGLKGILNFHGGYRF